MDHIESTPARVYLYNNNTSAERQKIAMAEIINGQQEKQATACKVVKSMNNRCENQIRRVQLYSERDINLAKLKKRCFEDEEDEDLEGTITAVRGMPTRLQMYAVLSSQDRSFIDSKTPAIKKKKKQAYHVY